MSRNKPKLPILNRSHPLARGLIGAWVMYEGAGSTVFDLHPLRRHGTMNGSVSWEAGTYGRALNFGGAAGDYVSIDDKGLGFSASSQFGIAPDTATSERTVFVVYKTTAGNASLLGVRHTADTDSTYDLQVGFDGADNNNSGKLSFIVRGHNGSGLTHIHDTIATNDGAWHSAAFWLDAEKRIRIYRDGTLAASGTHTMSVGISYDSVRLGDEVLNSAITNLSGSMAVALSFRRALTAAEICALHTDPYAAFRPRRPYAAIFPQEAAGGSSIPAIMASYRRRRIGL